MSFLERTTFTLDSANDHLAKIRDLQNDGSHVGNVQLIESYLVQYTLVAFYSEMEDELSKIIRKRLSVPGDEKLGKFLYNLNEKMIKRAKTSEIRSFLKNFGCETEELLGDVEERELSYYGAAIANRHQVSHATGASTTLSELQQALAAAKKILASVESCIR